ncbi:unnamed protein product, partial [Mesorhabditis belari]|uniref:Condensin complex subunit 2 n=1 Tax=Mesorhabditis belari TaxID=2138241 RepID=A0AAF3FL31_9BILA
MDQDGVTRRRRRPVVVAHKGYALPEYTNDSDSDGDLAVPQKRPAYKDDGNIPSTSSANPMIAKTEDGKTTSQANSKMKLVMDLFKKHHQKRGFNYFSHSIIEEIRLASTDQPLLDMAIAIEGASQVYSYRVETTMMHCKETHDICVGAKTKAATVDEIEITENGKLAIDETTATAKKNAGKPKTQMPKTTTRIGWRIYGKILASSKELQRVWKGKRKKIAIAMKRKSWKTMNQNPKLRLLFGKLLLGILIESNPKLVTDSSSLKVRRKESRQNSYYAAAIYNKNRNYSHRIFTMNCIRTQDARKFILHPRSVPDPEASFHKPYPKDCLDSLAGLCHNALSDKPQSYGYFFPKTTINTKDTALGVDGEEENYLLEQDELDDVITNQREDDTTIMPDRTLMDATLANRTSAFGGSGPKRVTLKGLGEKQIRMADLVDTFVGASIDPKLSMSLADMVRDLYSNALPMRRGTRTNEFNLKSDVNGDTTTIFEETRCVRLFGFGPIIAQLESSWHAEYRQLSITRDDYEDQMNAINELPDEKKDIAQRSVLPPGRYKLFAAPPDAPHNYPRDPASNKPLMEEANHLKITTEMAVSFAEYVDAFDDSGAGRLGSDAGFDTDLAPIPTDLLTDNNNDAQKDIPPHLDEQDAPFEAEAREEEIIPDFDLQRIGKIDDAHWNKKVEKRTEKEEQQRKETREQKKQAQEEFLNSCNLPYDDFISYHDSLANRFNSIPNREILEEKYLLTKKQVEEMIKSRLSESHKVQDIYDYNLFTKPCFLNNGRFGHCDFKPVPAPDKPLRKLPRFPGLEDDNCEDEDEDESPEEMAEAYVNWMSAFSLYYEPDERATLSSGNFRSQLENDNGGPSFPVGPLDFGDDDMGIDDFDDNIVEPINVSKQRRKNQFTFEHARMLEDNEEPAHEIETDKEAMNEEDARLLEQMLELARGAKQQRVDTLQVKLAIKQLLGNDDLKDGHLKRIAQGYSNEKNMLPIANRLAALSGCSDKENDKMEVDQCEVEAESTNVEEDTSTQGGLENKIKEALTAPPVDVEAAEVEEVEGMNDEEDDTHNVSLRVTNFGVEGEHSFSSLVSMLPLRLPAHDRQIHIATTLVIALHMCNENGLICEQQRSSSDGLDSSNWMSDFVFKNSDDAQPE